MKSKAFVLLSGGIDSTVCLYQAHDEFDGNVEGISIYYNQRHHREIEYARISCARLHVQHRIIKLDMPRSTLTDPTAKIPNVSYAEIEGVSPTYVPFRNGLMLSAVTALVHSEYVPLIIDKSPGAYYPEWAIYFGAHADDAHRWAYPDCTPEFIGAAANMIWVGTGRAVRLRTPLQWLVKPDIIKRGEILRIPWKDTWSCYVGAPMHCGSCPTCRARREAFIDAAVEDPTEYASGIAGIAGK